jgi:dTDP-4-dehydrorhamnose 3,5-epimerase
MEFKEISNSVVAIHIEPHLDERGSFTKIIGNPLVDAAFENRTIKQLNQSVTRNIGAIRGMHYQESPNQEFKIIRCVTGAVLDVAIDIRKGSPTFLEYLSFELTPNELNVVMIPEGFAHGFQCLAPNSTLEYIHSESYQPQSEGIVNYADPAIGIKWPLPVSDLSKRDAEAEFIDSTFVGLQA